MTWVAVAVAGAGLLSYVGGQQSSASAKKAAALQAAGVKNPPTPQPYQPSALRLQEALGEKTASDTPPVSGIVPQSPQIAGMGQTQAYPVGMEAVQQPEQTPQAAPVDTGQASAQAPAAGSNWLPYAQLGLQAGGFLSQMAGGNDQVRLGDLLRQRQQVPAYQPTTAQFMRQRRLY